LTLRLIVLAEVEKRLIVLAELEKRLIVLAEVEKRLIVLAEVEKCLIVLVSLGPLSEDLYRIQIRPCIDDGGNTAKGAT